MCFESHPLIYSTSKIIFCVSNYLLLTTLFWDCLGGLCYLTSGLDITLWCHKGQNCPVHWCYRALNSNQCRQSFDIMSNRERNAEITRQRLFSFSIGIWPSTHAFWSIFQHQETSARFHKELFIWPHLSKQAKKSPMSPLFCHSSEVLGQIIKETLIRPESHPG